MVASKRGGLLWLVCTMLLTTNPKPVCVVCWYVGERREVLSAHQPNKSFWEIGFPVSDGNRGAVLWRQTAISKLCSEKVVRRWVLWKRGTWEEVVVVCFKILKNDAKICDSKWQIHYKWQWQLHLQAKSPAGVPRHTFAPTVWSDKLFSKYASQSCFGQIKPTPILQVPNETPTVRLTIKHKSRKHTRGLGKVNVARIGKRSHCAVSMLPEESSKKQQGKCRHTW